MKQYQIRKSVQIKLKGTESWVSLEDMDVELKKLLCKKYPEMKIYFKRKEIEGVDGV